MTDKDEEEKEPSNPKPRKLKGTGGLHLGNNYADKLPPLSPPPPPPSVCIHCFKCNCNFTSNSEFRSHKCK
jgi:hypothetical protein